jgi:hypothetical protein
MKKQLGLLLLIFLFGLAAASTITQEQFAEGTEGSALEVIRDWKVLAVGAIVVSVILVAIAFVIGIGLEMPEIKAWASNELVQIFANVIIVIMLIVTIAFIDALVSAIVMTSSINIPECSTAGQSCLQAVVSEYLEQYVSAAEEGAKSTLLNNVDAMGMANRRLGLYCLTIYCLQAGYTTTIAGHYLLDVDMYSIIFEYYTNLLASMSAQQFFVNEICFKMGPVLLAVGIVARSFFFTRKMGGLLIAVALGVTFFFPGMYIFDWITLETALAGDKGLEDEEIGCPSECQKAAPIAYIQDTGQGLETLKEVYDAFSEADSDTAAGIIEGSVPSAIGSSGIGDGETIISCYTPSYQRCPQVCREIPYPSSMPICNNQTNETYIHCANLPVQCKVIRYVENIDMDEYNRCPDSCKVVPPLRNNCNEGDCLVSAYDCRMAYNDDLDWRPSKDNVDENAIKEKCNKADDCPASLTAEQSCVFVIPRTGSCSDLCRDCPAYCRVDGADPDNMPDSCKDGDDLLSACTSCIESCKVRMADIQNLPGASDCGSCPEEMRIIDPSMPDVYLNGVCHPDNCPLGSEYRIPIPRNTCESCLFTEESYMYNPPINMRCSDLCAPSDNAPVKDAGSYTKIGEGGLVGREEIKNVAKLIVPAYLLPLFNIVATLIFIKGLSGMLGGDIDIPGVSKVF